MQWPAQGATVLVQDVMSEALAQMRTSKVPPARKGVVVETPADGGAHLTIDTGGEYGCVTYPAFGFAASYTWKGAA
jgi:hypothetical protein